MAPVAARPSPRLTRGLLPPSVDVHEAARLLGLSPHTVRSRVQRQRLGLTTFRVGGPVGGLRFPLAELLAWIEGLPVHPRLAETKGKAVTTGTR